MTPAARERMRVRVPVFAVGAASWIILAALPDGTGHAGVHSAHGAAVPPAAQAALMFAAMMVPLSGAQVRHVRDRSLAHRRGRAVALFLAAYSLPWLAATLALVAAAQWVAGQGSMAVLVLAAAAVAVWQASPAKQRCLNRCHAHPPLAAFGARANGDVLRFGLSHAGWCIASCAGLMLLPMLFTRGHLVAMALVTLWLAGERVAKPAAPRWRWRGPEVAVRIVLARARALWGGSGTALTVPRLYAFKGAARTA